MPSNDPPCEAPARSADDTRREILEILSETGITPGQGVEGMLDRFLGRGAER
jgi:hypothetical protein